MNRTHGGIYADLKFLQTQVRDVLWDLERLDNNAAYDDEVDDPSALGERLANLLTVLEGRLTLYADALALPSATAQVKDWSQRWGHAARAKTDQWRVGDADGRESPAFNDLVPLLDGILVLVAPDVAMTSEAYERRDRWRLEYCLRSMAKVCAERNVVPTCESDVQAVMHSHLEAVFPDYTRKVTISKPLVSFKPDGGVVSLKSAIECKFVGSQGEVGTAVHGLTEDLSGYRGSEDWKHFLTLIYMVGPFAVEGQFDRALELSGSTGTWTTVLVTGPGQRKSRADAGDAK